MTNNPQIVADNQNSPDVSRYCNFCGLRFKSFIFFNGREARCPKCGSLERQRHFYIHLLSLFPFLSGKKVLHFAPERIIKEVLLNSKAEYYDADIDSFKATYVVDITNINFEESFFDYIICFHVLEHIPDDKKAMTELFRVLKPGGTAFLAVPLSKYLIEDSTVVSAEERKKIFGQSDHVRRYDLNSLLERLNNAGFDTNSVSDPNLFPKALKDAKLGNTIIFAKK